MQVRVINVNRVSSFIVLIYCILSRARVWIYDQQIKKLERQSRKQYARAFLLRRKMLLFIQNISYYMTNEVIEQHWSTFMNVIKKVRNLSNRIVDL